MKGINYGKWKLKKKKGEKPKLKINQGFNTGNDQSSIQDCTLCEIALGVWIHYSNTIKAHATPRT